MHATFAQGFLIDYSSRSIRVHSVGGSSSIITLPWVGRLLGKRRVDHTQKILIQGQHFTHSSSTLQTVMRKKLPLDMYLVNMIDPSYPVQTIYSSRFDEFLPCTTFRYSSASTSTTARSSACSTSPARSPANYAPPLRSPRRSPPSPPSPSSTS